MSRVEISRVPTRLSKELSERCLNRGKSGKLFFFVFDSVGKIIIIFLEMNNRCEGARLMMNPLGNMYNLNKARIFLNFAIYFTPQYGDSFIEGIKLNLLLSFES